MANQITTQNIPFPHKRMRALLGRGKCVCIVGYGLSSEARAPHYYDIQKGAWSSLTESSRINPFEHTEHYQLVMQWFNWRRGGSITRQPSKPFVALKELQRLFGIRVASQCSDGLALANGVVDVCELYGNVLRVRCTQGHSFSDWPSVLNGDDNKECSVCGSILLPDVQMFSWNHKSESSDAASEMIKHAKLLIKIGADDDLAPFINLEQSDIAHLPVIEIMESGFQMHEGNASFKISMADIDEEIKLLTGESQLAASPKSYEAAIRNFITLYQHRKQDSDHE